MPQPTKAQLERRLAEVNDDVDRLQQDKTLLLHEREELREQLETINQNVIVVIGRPDELQHVGFGEADLVIRIDADLRAAQIIKNVSGVSGHHARLFVDRDLSIDYWQERYRAHTADCDAEREKVSSMASAARQLRSVLGDAWWMQAADLLNGLASADRED